MQGIAAVHGVDVPQSSAFRYGSGAVANCIRASCRGLRIRIRLRTGLRTDRGDFVPLEAGQSIQMKLGRQDRGK